MIITNKKGISDSFVKLIKANFYDVSRKDQSIISVTDLIDSPRIRQLRIRHWDLLEEDVSDMDKRLRGEIFHRAAEKVNDPYWIIEKRMNIPIDGIIVSGKADLYRFDESRIEDYKTIELKSYKYAVNGKRKWEEQLNCYAHLWKSYGFKVEALQVNLLIVDFKSYMLESGGSDNLPESSMITIPIKLWEPDFTTNYIYHRIKQHKEAQSLSDNQIPICTEEERIRTDTIFKLFKDKNVRSSAYTYDESECESILNKYKEKFPKSNFRWDKKEGEDKRCKMCLVRNFCCHYRKTNNDN